MESFQKTNLKPTSYDSDQQGITWTKINFAREVFLTCLNEDQAKYMLQEVHEGVCGNHSSGRALAHKVLRQGYYWPTIQADSLAFVQKCDKCQHFPTIPCQPPEELTVVSSPWPFAKWGIDLIGHFPTSRG